MAVFGTAVYGTSTYGDDEQPVTPVRRVEGRGSLVVAVAGRGSGATRIEGR